MSFAIQDKFQKLAIVTRASDWRLSFVPFIMGGVYLWIWWFDLEFSGSLLIVTLLSLITTIGFASLGYFINEFFDKASDARAGKVNKLTFLSPLAQLGIFIGSLSLTFLPWLGLPFDKLSIGLITLELMLFLIYSLPFPRLKENPYFSLIIDSAYAYVVPLLLSFYTFSLFAGKSDWPIWLWCFVLFVLFMGIRNLLMHQVVDALNDLRSNIKTAPLIIGRNGISYVITTVFLYEQFFTFAWIVLLSIDRPVFSIWILFFGFFIGKGFQNFTTYQKFQKQGLITINNIYQYVFPVFILLLLIFKQPYISFVIIGLHLLFFVQYDVVGKIFQLCTKGYYVTTKIYWTAYVWIRHVVSAAVNYPIYYIFLLFGIDLRKEKKSAKQYLQTKKLK